MSKGLFDRLINHAETQGVSILDKDKTRFIKRLNTYDAELMAKAEASALIVTQQIKLVKIEWDGATFFSFFGLSSNDGVPSGLGVGVRIRPDVAEDILPDADEDIQPDADVVVNITPGTFALSIIKSDMRPSADPSLIRQVIEEPEVDGFDLDDITKLFPTAHIYEVTQAHDFHQSKERVLGSILSKAYLDGPILLNSDTTALLADIFEGGSEFIPFRNLLQGILAISWENLFLETYRCIEQMFTAPSMKKLCGSLNTGLSPFELATRLEKNLSWRPREETALSNVIEFCDDTAITTALLALGGTTPADPDRLAPPTAHKIYQLRNSIVHHRPNTAAPTKSDKEWNEIICAMLEIVRQIYDRQGRDFFEAPTAGPIPAPAPQPQAYGDDEEATAPH